MGRGQANPQKAHCDKWLKTCGSFQQPGGKRSSEFVQAEEQGVRITDLHIEHRVGITDLHIEYRVGITDLHIQVLAPLATGNWSWEPCRMWDLSKTASIPIKGWVRRNALPPVQGDDKVTGTSSCLF